MKPYAIIMPVIEVPLCVNAAARPGWLATLPPPTSASNNNSAPMIDASPTFPGRHRFIHHPISSAIGIVQAIVNRPHGDPRKALTTISARTASKMIMIARTAIIAVTPVTLLTSSLAIWPSDLPSRRSEQNRIVKSWTAPPSTTPMTSHSVPGRKPNCAASTGPTSGPAPAIAAKWWPNSTHRFVGTKS